MTTNNSDTKEKQCLSCGKNFTPERRTKKYCSDTCKQIAFYQRNAGSQEALNDNSKISFSDINNQAFNSKQQEKNGYNLISEGVKISDENKKSLTSVTLNDKLERINETISDNINSASLHITCLAASMMACKPEAHKRFTVFPATVTGKPASNAAILATLRLSSPA